MKKLEVTSYDKVCANAGLKFVCIITNRVELAENQYYALMVTDSDGANNPHCVGIDYLTHHYLIGVERPNSKMGAYISKDFYSRKAGYRGNTIVVEVDDVTNFTVLTK